MVSQLFRDRDEMEFFLNCLESTRINIAQLLSIWEPEPWGLTKSKSSTDGDANPTSQSIRVKALPHDDIVDDIVTCDMALSPLT